MATTDTPIVVNPSLLPSAGGTILRDILVIAAALPILVKLIGSRDLRGIIDWIGSSDGATVIAIVVPLLVSGWRAWRSTKQKAKFVTVAAAAPDSVAVVTKA